MGNSDLIESDLTRSVIGAFFEVYNHLEYGFLESIYLAALEMELCDRGHSIVREAHIGVTYKGRPVGAQRLDLLVDGKVVVEVKSTEHLPPNAIRQLDSYLKGTSLKVGLLLHFGPQAKFYRRIRAGVQAEGQENHKLPTTNDLTD